MEEIPTEDKTLLPIREDVAEWLSTILGYKIRQDCLFDELQTGTILCQTAQTICQLVKKNTRGKPRHDKHSAQSDIYENDENSNPLPKPPKYSSKAKPGSFLARDNTANFIAWCRTLGIKDTFMFESEGLVLQTRKRNVLLCLLEVSRHMAKYGLPTSQLIHLERDIDYEQAKESHLLKQINCQDDELAHVPPSLDRRKRSKVLLLDNMVHKVVDNSKLAGLVDIERTGEGRYRIRDKLVFIRMLRNQHVMVRVGGGWDTLEHYLLSHEATRFEQQFKLLSFIDHAKEHDGYQWTNNKKFHQVRTRIALRAKQS